MDEYPTETQIILILKEKGDRSLQQLSDELKISKMGVLNHVKRLEEQGLIRRIQKKGKVGRPFYLFNVTENSKENLASSSSWMLSGLIKYLKETGNGDLVEHFLNERYDQTRLEYEKRMSHIQPDKRLQELVRIRQEENYYPLLKTSSSGTFELQEFNCPIYQISRHFGVACGLETRLFSSVLDMDVESTHRQVDGHGVCRFIIRERLRQK
ncbi:MAG: transcriptional regulator [Candidatus Thermoplasmatota archaeon]|nr:transcriptional regulator [Candidatus Thermoplasmatota archaeon]